MKHSTEKSGNGGDQVVEEEVEGGGGEAAEEVGGGGAAGGGGHGLEVGPSSLLYEAVADGNLLPGVRRGGGGVHGEVGGREHVSEGRVGGGKGGCQGDKFQASGALRRRSGGEGEFGGRCCSDGVVAAEGWGLTRQVDGGGGGGGGLCHGVSSKAKPVVARNTRWKNWKPRTN